MDRKENLLKLLDTVDESKKEVITPIIDDIVFIEQNLVELRKLPFISVCPTNKELQKQTPAFKQYKELIQQYTNIVKLFIGALGISDNTNTDTSVIANYMDNFNKFMENIK